MPRVLGQGIFAEVRTALADHAAGNGGGKGYSRKRHWPVCHLRRKKGSFEYWIAGLYKGGGVPEGLKLYTFPESDWAMFSAKGPLPGSLQELNTQVWQEWYPNEGQKYRGNGNAMLEVYSPGDMQSPDYECGIWVPIFEE